MIRRLFGQFLYLGLSSTAKHTYWVFAGDVVFTLSTFLATILVARTLTVSHFGVYVVHLSLLILAVDVADLGVGNALSHFVPTHFVRNEFNKAWSMVKTAIFFVLLVGILIVFFSNLFAYHISVILFKTDLYANLIRLIGLASSLAIFMGLTGWILTSLEKFPQRAIIISLPAVVRLAIFGTLFIKNSLTLPTVIIVTVVSFIPSLTIGLFFVGKAWLSTPTSLTMLRNLLSFSVFIGASKGLTSLASRLDVIMMSLLIGSMETGIYGAASRITLLFPMLAGSFSSVLAPKFAKLENFPDLFSFLKKVIVAVIMLFSTTVLIAVFADPLINVTFGREYQQSVDVLRWLMIPNVLFLASIPSVNLVIFRIKKPHLITLTTIIQLVIIIIFNLIFIPKLGRFGPIPGLTLAFAQVLLLTGLVSMRFLKAIEHDKK